MLDGILNIYKLPGITSFGVVSEIRRILKVTKGGIHSFKVGHAGTLDPEAKGILLVCLGKATKLVPYLMHLDKEYKALMKLGEETTTEDRTGEITKVADPTHLSSEMVKKAFEHFQGEIEQTAPLYSALKYKGQPLYKYARKGQFVTPPTRKITIYEMEVLEVSNPFVQFRVRCSKGTYVRSLCRDVGRKLEVFGHLVELERTRCGFFDVSSSIRLELLKNDESLPIVGLSTKLYFTPYTLCVTKLCKQNSEKIIKKEK